MTSLRKIQKNRGPKGLIVWLASRHSWPSFLGPLKVLRRLLGAGGGRWQEKASLSQSPYFPRPGVHLFLPQTTIALLKAHFSPYSGLKFQLHLGFSLSLILFFDTETKCPTFCVSSSQSDIISFPLLFALCSAPELPFAFPGGSCNFLMGYL